MVYPAAHFLQHLVVREHAAEYEPSQELGGRASAPGGCGREPDELGPDPDGLGPRPDGPGPVTECTTRRAAGQRRLLPAGPWVR